MKEIGILNRDITAVFEVNPTINMGFVGEVLWDLLPG
jgi:hypothetical protein